MCVFGLCEEREPEEVCQACLVTPAANAGSPLPPFSVTATSRLFRWVLGKRACDPTSEGLEMVDYKVVE